MAVDAGRLDAAGSLDTGKGQSYQSGANEAVIGRQEVQALETTAEVPILMYHSIDDRGPTELAPYRVSPAVFESQIRYLADHGYYGISLEQWAEAIAAGRRVPGRPVIITFDDGYLNFLENAWPVLERGGFTATMFVVTDKVGQTADWDTVTGENLRLMSWDDLRSLRDRGLMIGSHTASHPSLTTLSMEEIVHEGQRARTELHQKLGIDATSIAFPYGHTDEKVRAALAQAGYTIAVGTWGGMSTLLHNPLNLPRIEVFPDEDLAPFAAKVARRRARLIDLVAPPSAKPAALAFPSTYHNFEGDHMLIHPDYAQRLAAQLDTLVGEFVALHSQILTVGAQAPTLQAKLAQLFRQPLTGKMHKYLAPYEPLSGDICVGFETEARVMLEVEPKLDHSLSPESCINTLDFSFTGPSRWLSLELACEWADISSAQRYQLGIYGTVSRSIMGRAVLRFPGRDGVHIDEVFANFELGKDRRNLNKSGELPHIDFVNIDTDKRPTLIIFLETTELPEIVFKLNYLSVYFD